MAMDPELDRASVILFEDRKIELDPVATLGLPAMQCYEFGRGIDAEKLFMGSWRSLYTFSGVKLLAGGRMISGHIFEGCVKFETLGIPLISFAGEVTLDDYCSAIHNLKGAFFVRIPSTESGKTVHLACQCEIALSEFDNGQGGRHGFIVNVPFVLSGHRKTSSRFYTVDGCVRCSSTLLCKNFHCFAHVGQGVNICSGCRYLESPVNLQMRARTARTFAVQRASIHPARTPAVRAFQVSSQMDRCGFFVSRCGVDGFYENKLPSGLERISSIQVRSGTLMSSEFLECPVVMSSALGHLRNGYCNYADPSLSPLVSCSIPLYGEEEVLSIVTSFHASQSRLTKRPRLDSSKESVTARIPNIKGARASLWEIHETTSWSEDQCLWTHRALIDAFRSISQFLFTALGDVYRLVHVDIIFSRPQMTAQGEDGNYSSVRDTAPRRQWWHRDFCDADDYEGRAVTALIPLSGEFKMSVRSNSSDSFDHTDISVLFGDFAVWFGWLYHRALPSFNYEPCAYGYFLREHNSRSFEKKTNWDLDWVTKCKSEALHMFGEVSRDRIAAWIDGKGDTPYWADAERWWEDWHNSVKRNVPDLIEVSN